MDRRNDMSVHIELDLPEGTFSSLRTSPERFVGELRLAAAAKWYEMRLLSQSKAAEVAGVSRQEFVEALGRLGVSPVQTTPDELAAEVNRE
jgi:predicted HTH domain antitoxin